MTREQVVDLLTAMAVYDGRHVGADKGSLVEAAFWYRHVKHMDYADAEEAVHRHYGDSVDRMMTAHCKRLVREIRAERSRHAILPPPSVDPDRPGAYAAELRDTIRRLAERTQLPGISGGNGDGGQR